MCIGAGIREGGLGTCVGLLEPDNLHLLLRDSERPKALIADHVVNVVAGFGPTLGIAPTLRTVDDHQRRAVHARVCGSLIHERAAPAAAGDIPAAELLRGVRHADGEKHGLPRGIRLPLRIRRARSSPAAACSAGIWLLLPG